MKWVRPYYRYTGWCIVLLLAVSLFGSCSNRKAAGEGTSSNPAEQKPTISAASKDWVRDSVGCMHLRTNELAEKLIIEHDLKQGTKAQFLRVFGEPNTRKTSTGQGEVLVYYFSSVCNNRGRLNMDGDKCYAEFSFNDEDKYEGASYPCE